MRSHGSGQACNHAKTKPACEVCKAWQREYRRKRTRTPGTYEYDRAHGIGRPGQLKMNYVNKWRRGRADASDLAALAALTEGIVNAETD